ncbi:superoxide dismutase [Candidatus Dojkabacteria bacterium]|uniref:Superoxide dismutase n=1 Tax=Candidatus Dojkabacteria bacterium TaxID=2099670 RepID=A0A3M0Z207_9BACT|nr:MAG: superoxide dismutase [Candidatus Dojkabacteria bacterium]
MYPFNLPKLNFNYSDLEPIIDSKTMDIHYNKHHGGYVNNLNILLVDFPEFHGYSAEGLLINHLKLPESIRQAVINNAGGHLNHTLFWDILTPGGSVKPIDEIKDCIDECFGSFDQLKNRLIEEGLNRFGSGWVWLVTPSKDKLEVLSTPNQDNPVMIGKKPVLGIDLWEHAYYLQYQNRRKDYLESVITILNWDKINFNFLSS